MNARVKISDVVTTDDSMLVTGSLEDPTGRWTTLSVASIMTALRLFAACMCAERRVFAAFNVVEVLASTRKQFTVRVVSDGELALARLTIPVGTDAFVCSMLNGVDDVPSATALGISPALTAWARTHGLSTNFAPALIQLSRNLGGLFPNLNAEAVEYTLTANDLVGDVVYLRTPSNEALVKVVVNGAAFVEDSPNPQLTLSVDRRTATVALTGSLVASLDTAVANGQVKVSYQRWMSGYRVTRGFATIAQLFPDEYPAIVAVPMETFSSTITFANTTSVRGMFAGCASLVNPPALTVPSAVTDFSELFMDCASAEVVHLEDVDTSSATTFADMFAGCSKLARVDLSTWSTGACRQMERMFSGCTALTSVVTGSGWSTAAVVDMHELFLNCSALTSCPVVLDCAAVSSVNAFRNMFTGTQVSAVTLKNVASGLRGATTGALLRSDGALAVTFA